MTSASTVDVPEDKAYLAHHFNCPTCIAAGATPGKQARCADGLQLWEAYLQAFGAHAQRRPAPISNRRPGTPQPPN